MSDPAEPTPAEVPIRARHFRAPQGDGEVLFEPRLAASYDLLAANRKSLYRLEHNIGGHPLIEVQDDARPQLLSASLGYTCDYRDHPLAHAPIPQHPWFVLSGHQPTLFHPGVWLKNFALDNQANLANCVAINLIVDSDLAGHSAVRVPVGTVTDARAEEVPIDEPGDNIPFEEQHVRSLSQVRSFTQRLQAKFNDTKWFGAGHAASLIAGHLWRYVEYNLANSQDLRLGELLASARHRLEQDYALQTLEIPLSLVVQTIPFRYFALHLLTECRRLREVYNRSLIEYRSVNRIRSTSHPVPELTCQDDWIETPFWVWTTEQPQRRRLFAKSSLYTNGRRILQFTDRDNISFRMDYGGDDASSWPEQWHDLESRGIKIRPRALITTMYARLFLSDLFIHGIGGAKYDELTDAIIRRFFGIEPPAFMTVTGTVRLPIPRPATTAADVRSAKQLVREIRFHPERFVNDAAPAIRESAQTFALKKQELLRQHQFQFRQASRESFHALDDLNRQLNMLLVDVESRLRDEVTTRETEAEQARMLGSREFSFVLHPADELPAQLKRMAQGSPSR